jgi:hypothetical protein
VGQVDRGPTRPASSGDERKQMGHDDGIGQNEDRKIMGCRNWFWIFFIQGFGSKIKRFEYF